MLSSKQGRFPAAQSNSGVFHPLSDRIFEPWCRFRREDASGRNREYRHCRSTTAVVGYLLPLYTVYPDPVDERDRSYSILLEIPETKGKYWSIGKIGGLPDLFQSFSGHNQFRNHMPLCPECKRLMFFVGEVYTIQTAFNNKGRYIFPEITTFGFVCEDCGIGRQMTTMG